MGPTNKKMIKQSTKCAGIGNYPTGVNKGKPIPAQMIRTLEILNYGDGVSLALAYEPRARKSFATVAIVDGIAYIISTNPQFDAHKALEKSAKQNNTTPEAMIRKQVQELTAKGLINK